MTVVVDASLAHADLLEWPIALFPYTPFAGRVWELRANLTAYDAWYVALAEQLAVPLATLDLRLAGASGPQPAPAREAAPRSANPSRKVGTLAGHQRGHPLGH